MAISVRCRCGGEFAAKDEHAGRRARCPTCGDVLVIPPNDRSDAIGGGDADDGDWEEDRDSLRVMTHVRDLLVDCASALEQLSGRISQLVELTRESVQSTQVVPKQYKILTQKDKWFSGKFDPATLEQALNSYAEQGWTVSTTATATIPGFGGNREEIIVILER